MAPVSSHPPTEQVPIDTMVEKPRIAILRNSRFRGQYSMLSYATWLQETLAETTPNVRILDQSGPRWLWRWPRLAALVGKFLSLPLQVLCLPPETVLWIPDHSLAMYLWCSRSQRRIVTCHDLHSVQIADGEFPGVVQPWQAGAQQWVMRRALPRATHVLAISDYTRRIFERKITTRASVRTVHNPLKPGFQRLSAAETWAQLSERLPSRFRDQAPILHVGNGNWYKNRGMVLQAYAALRRHLPDAPPLLMVGKPLGEALENQVDSLGIRSHLAVLTHSTDQQVNAAYNLAALLLFPSLSEGFGWPIIEAQSVGCPVVCSQGGSLAEISGGSALEVPHQDPDAYAAAMASLLETASLREQVIAQGYRNLDRFREAHIREAYRSYLQEVSLPD